MDPDAPLFETAKTQLLEIFKSAVTSVLPGKLIENKVRLLDSDTLAIGDVEVQLSKDVYIVGFGKAVEGMAVALERVLGGRLKRGIISVPKRPQISGPGQLVVEDLALRDLAHEVESQLYDSEILKRSKLIEVLQGAEDNRPDEASLAATARIADMVNRLGAKDTLLVLISGGGSALLVQPREPIAFSEKQAIVERLQLAGATIFELNQVRKHLSAVKGGGLAELASPASVVSLILSDVIGDPCDIIASGPTCPIGPLVKGRDPAKEALDILRRYGAMAGLDKEIINSIKNRARENSNLIEDGNYTHVQNIVIGNNSTALLAAEQTAKALDLKPVILTSEASGDVADLSFAYASLARHICLGSSSGLLADDQLARDIGPLNIRSDRLQDILSQVSCLREDQGLLLLGGGESTVRVIGRGKGGRNQELALTFSLDWLAELAKDQRLAKHYVLFLSVGTDGQDGPTLATGAFGRPAIRPIMQKVLEEMQLKIEDCRDSEETEMLKCKLQQIIDMMPENVLKRNDSYNFYSRFESGKNHVVTGLTGTNVMDLHFVYIKKRHCECDVKNLASSSKLTYEVSGQIFKFLTVNKNR